MMSSVRAALCAYCHFVVQSFGSRMTVCVKVLFNMGCFKARQIPVDLICPPKDQCFCHQAFVFRAFHTVTHWILSRTTYRIIFKRSEEAKKLLSKAQNTAELVIHPVLTAALGLIERRPSEEQRRKTAPCFCCQNEDTFLKKSRGIYRKRIK